jgi:hypothetical protein
MVSNSQIKERLAQYLAARITLEQFEDWFVPNTRDIRRTHSKAAISLAFEIEGSLSEYLSRVLDEQELRNELLQILHADSKFVEIIDRPQQVFSFRSSTPVAFLPIME